MKKPRQVRVAAWAWPATTPATIQRRIRELSEAGDLARNVAYAFDRMLDEMWRVLRPGGLFFARLASTIGLEGRVRPLEGRWFQLPDGSERFLVDEELLRRTSDRLGGVWLDPLKTTLVQNLRSMSTWVLRKGA